MNLILDDEEKATLIAKIYEHRDMLDSISRSYGELLDIALKDGSSPAFIDLVESIGAMVASGITDIGNVMKNIMENCK